MKKLLPLLLSPVLLVSAFAFQDSAPIPLWPEGVPASFRPDSLAAKGAVPPEEVLADGRVAHVSVPSMIMIPAGIDRPTGTAVVICPGGGYSFLSREREGYQYARWLSSLGITSFILNSRLGDFGHPAPLQDVLRAIRIVRSRAAEFKIDPDRIGVMGSSAGGHLAASASTLFDHADGKTGAELDAVSARPDFSILMYPVITLLDPAAHVGSRKQLLGENPPAELVDQMSLEKQVTEKTPPTLIIHTQEDRTVPIENALLYFQALTRAKVPAELYAFERGSHGMGMRNGLGTSSDWPKRAEEYLRDHGWLTAPKKAEATK